jgi:broad specificity phosphatase PhoE
MLRPEPHLRIFLVRHGEVENAEGGRLYGHQDAALSVRGEAQMAEAAEALGQRPLTAIYASDLYRARRGAELTAQKTGLQPKLLPELREIDFGQLSGLTVKEALLQMGGDVSRLTNWVDNRFPGGENLLDMKNRVMTVFDRIKDKESGEIAVFAHGGTNRLIIFTELELNLKNLFMLDQAYGCVNIIDYYAVGGKVLKLLNGRPSCLADFEPV